MERALVAARIPKLSQRYIITGGAGFIGSHLAERLLDAGHRVTCIDNFLTGAHANLAALHDRDGFELIEHNITTTIKVDGDVDSILHFASPASPIDYLELPIQTLKVGALGTHNVLGLAKAKGARFLLASTSEVYGDPLVHPQPLRRILGDLAAQQGREPLNCLPDRFVLAPVA